MIKTDLWIVATRLYNESLWLILLQQFPVVFANGLNRTCPQHCKSSKFELCQVFCILGTHSCIFFVCLYRRLSNHLNTCDSLIPNTLQIISRLVLSGYLQILKYISSIILFSLLITTRLRLLATVTVWSGLLFTNLPLESRLVWLGSVRSVWNRRRCLFSLYLCTFAALSNALYFSGRGITNQSIRAIF